MKRLIIFLLLFAAIKVAGQTTGYLRFDTVKIMKQNGTCELYIINKTKDSLGLLTNVGGGLTRFVKPRKLNDSTLVIGLDTIFIAGNTSLFVPRISSTDQEIVRFNGTNGDIQGTPGVTANGSGNFTVPNFWTLTNANGLQYAMLPLSHGYTTPATSSTNTPFDHVTGAQTQSSGNLEMFRIATLYNQTSTAGATDLIIRRTETAVGSGQHDFLRFDGGVAGTTERFSIDRLGRVKVGTLDNGTASDSVVVWDASTRYLKKIDQSSISTGISQLTGQVIAGPGSGSQVATIATNTVSNSNLRQSAGLSVIGRSTNSTGNVADITGTANQVARVSSDGTTLGFGAINLASTAAVTGLLPNANLSFTGTPDGTKFLRDDFSWQTVSGGGTPGGANTQIQFNNSGAFGGNAGFTWNNTNKEVQIMSTGETVNGAVFDLYLNKVTPAINDRMYEIHGYSNNSSGVKTQMVADYAEAAVVTAGSETGKRLMNVTIAGALREFFNASANGTNNGVRLSLANNFHMNEISGKFWYGTSGEPSSYFLAQNSVNGQMYGSLLNTNTGTSAYAEWNVSTSTGFADAVRLLKMSNTWSATGIYKQDVGILISGSDVPGGLNIGTANSSAPLRFYTGGEADANERGSFSSTGIFRLNTLDTDLTPPTTTGTTKMVITDGNGDLSFADIPGGGAGITGSGTANFGAKFTGASTIGNSLYQDNGTNTAINMAPSTDGRFQVLGATGTTNTSAIARFLAAAGEGIYLGYNTTSDYGFIGAARDGVAHDNLAIAQSGGNVTVGGTTFSEKLRVVGSLRAGASTEASATSTPAFYVAVDGLAAVAIRNATSDIEGYHLVGTSGSETGYIFGSVTDHSMYFRTNNLTRATILNSGNFGIGTTSPDNLLHAELSGSATTTTGYPFRLTHITSGTSAPGLGVGAEFEVENASGTNRVTSRMRSIYTTATDAAENADIVFENIAAGSIAEKFRINSSGTGRFTGGIELGTLSNGTTTDSLLVITNTQVKKIAPTTFEPIEVTTTASTTTGGASQNVDITLNTNLHGEIEVYVVGIGGTTSGSYHYRTFIYFAGNGASNAPTINSTTLQGGPLTLEGIGGTPSTTISAISSPTQGVRIALNASSTEDVAWKVHYKIRSHTFPL